MHLSEPSRPKTEHERCVDLTIDVNDGVLAQLHVDQVREAGRDAVDIDLRLEHGARDCRPHQARSPALFPSLS